MSMERALEWPPGVRGLGNWSQLGCRSSLQTVLSIDLKGLIDSCCEPSGIVQNTFEAFCVGFCRMSFPHHY